MTITVEERHAAIDLLLQIVAHAPEVFSDAFDRTAAAGTPRFSAILADARNDRAAALQAAANRAIEGNFYVSLLKALNPILSRREDLRNRLPRNVLLSMSEAEHHAVFDNSGMWDVARLDVLAKITPYVGVIRITSLPQPYVGTGILVGSGLMLTAAHVVASLIDFTTIPPSARDARKAQVEFHHPKVVDENLQPVVAKFASDWLEICSAPCGKPPNLNARDEQLASRNLDFALIRLVPAVGRKIGFARINASTPANDNHIIAVAGHMAGTSLRFHLGRLIKHNKPTKRLHHHANAAPGVSGSPCVDIQGSILGIHEGAVYSKGVPDYNRSICLNDIREVIAAMDPDPLSDDNLDMVWLPQSVSADLLTAMKISPMEADRHPVVGRHSFQEWMKTAAAARSSRRFAMVSGPEGSGKSFTDALLRARSIETADIFVGVSPEVARETDITALLERIAASAANATAATVPSNLRPDAGILRHDIIPNGLDLVERQLKRRPGTSAPLLWLSIDFGNDAQWLSGHQDAWKSFFSEALKRSWLRLTVAGISEGRQAEFRALFSASADIYSETLVPLAWPEIEAFASGSVGSSKPADQKNRVLDRMRQSWERKAAGLAPHALWRMTIDLLLQFNNLVAEA
jgi:V8-like Glu-specific endopeptidase